MAENEIDEISGVETTGHEWDGIKELNNPLPRWWINTFYLCIIWAIGYMILYPAWPLVSDYTRGYLGYSSRAEFSQSMTEARAEQAVYLDRISEASLQDISASSELRQFAFAGGRSAYLVNCSACHGLGAEGAPGYPNLNDDDWIWGGTLDDIYLTIQHGVRFTDDWDTRDSAMPAFGRDGILGRDEIVEIAAFVRSMAGLDADPALAASGAAGFADNCAACHGATGEGLRDLGAPVLADAIWFYSSDVDAIAAQITDPKHGVMPAWEARLDDGVIKQLTVYIHSLGGGE